MSKQFDTRDLNLHVEKADESSSGPYGGVEVLVSARNQSWRSWTDNKGVAHFTKIPCGGTVTIKLLNAEQPFRTITFSCQQTPANVNAFLARSCRSSLQLIAKQANLTKPLPGVVTQRILFRRGTIASVIDDSVPASGIHNYLLTARKGQEISIHIVPLEEGTSVVFDVYFLRDPGTYIRPLGARAGCIANENVTDFKGVLPQSGDYVISVYADGGAGRYSLDVIVQ